MTTHTIDTCTNIYSPGLKARQIWQKLFRLTKAERFPDLDCFLCDLYAFQRIIEEGRTVFFWRYHKSGYTDTTTYDPHDRNVFRIEIQAYEIIITETADADV